MPQLARLTQSIVIALYACVAIAGSGTWTPIGPPVAYMQAIAIDPTNSNTMYAGTRGGGVFKTTDGGTTWLSINSGILGPTDSSTPEGRWIYCLAIDPTNSQIVYAGSSSSGVYRSANGGQTWTLTGRPGSVDTVQTIAIDPNNTAILYAGTNSHLYKSTNSGANWTDISSAIAVTNVTKIVIGGSTIYALAQWLFRSTDAGATFTRIDGSSSLDPTVHDFDVDPTNSSRIFRVDSNYIYRSTDSGANWNGVYTFSFAAPANKIAISRSSPNTVYASSGINLYKTTNGGTNWSTIGSGLPADYVRLLTVDPANSSRLFAGFSCVGLYRSIDGSSFSRSDSGIVAASQTRFSTGAGSTIYASCYCQDDNAVLNTVGVWRSADEGSSWTRVTTPFSDYYQDAPLNLVAHPYQASVAFAIAAQTFDHTGLISRSGDSGATWTAVHTGLPTSRNPQSLAFDSANANLVYLASGQGVYKSTDGGVSWSPTALSNATNKVWVDQRTHSLYATNIDTSSSLYKSTDQGASWNDIASTSGNTSQIDAFVVDPANDSNVWIYASHVYFPTIYKTTNGGSSWTYFYPTGLGTQISFSDVAVDPSNSQTLYLSTGGEGAAASSIRGMYKSTNSGTSWTAFNSTLEPDRNVLRLEFFSTTTLLASTYMAGLWHYSFGGAPPTPSNVVATGMSSSRVDISWNAVAGATSYQLDRKSEGTGYVQIATPMTNSYSDTGLTADRAYIYRVRAVSATGTSSNSASDLATTVTFTDNNLTTGFTIRAVHLTELRTAANAIRRLGGIGDTTFSDPTLTGQIIKAIHLTEVRNAVDTGRTAVGLTNSSYTDNSPTGVKVKASHILELRLRVQ